MPHKLIGGEKIGEGGFGCVYNPALECAKPENTARIKAKFRNTSFSKTISKALMKAAADEEIATARKVASIDPQGKYFSYPSETCGPNLNSPQIKDCSVIYNEDTNEPNVNTQLVYSPYSGKDFSKYPVPPNEIVNFFVQGGNLLEGLLLMYKNNAVHCDIKGDNILVDKVKVKIGSGLLAREKQEYQIKFIDFGLTATVDELLEKILNKTTPFPSLSQPHQPIDKLLLTKKEELMESVTVLEKVFNGEADPVAADAPAEKQEQVKQLRSKISNAIYLFRFTLDYTVRFSMFEDGLKRSIQGTNFNENNATVPFTEQAKDCIKTISKLKFARKAFWDPILAKLEAGGENAKKEILLGIDIFSLAGVLESKWASITGHTKTGPTQISLGKGFQVNDSEKRRLHEKFVREVDVPFFALLEKMYDPNPFTRIKPQEALTEYKQKFYPALAKFIDTNGSTLFKWETIKTIDPLVVAPLATVSDTNNINASKFNFNELKTNLFEDKKEDENYGGGARRKSRKLRRNRKNKTQRRHSRI